MTEFQQTKVAISEFTGLANDALHIYVALAVFLGTCILFKWRAWQVRPWLAVLVVALAGEAWDIHDQLAAGSVIDWREGTKDLINTILVPTIIVIAARYGRMFTRS